MKEYYIESELKLKGHSSRGYAEKYSCNGYWYKVSAGAFNAQAEVIASRLIKYTNIVNAVHYTICKVNGKYATRSKDFTGSKQLETIGSLYLKQTGSLIETATGNMTAMQLVKVATVTVNKATGIPEQQIRDYLSLMVQFDAFVLNEDRHFYNIGVLRGRNGWHMAPIFDFDCCLFSCLEDLSDESIEKYEKSGGMSLPFANNHIEQVRLISGISKAKLQMRKYNVHDIIRGVWDKDHMIGKRVIERYLKSVLSGMETV